MQWFCHMLGVPPMPRGPPCRCWLLTTCWPVCGGSACPMSCCCDSLQPATSVGSPCRMPHRPPAWRSLKDGSGASSLQLLCQWRPQWENCTLAIKEKQWLWCVFFTWEGDSCTHFVVTFVKWGRQHSGSLGQFERARQFCAWAPGSHPETAKRGY